MAGNCHGPAFGNALNRPSEMGVGFAVTGMPTAEVTARSVRSMECLPFCVTSQSWSLNETSSPWSGRIGPTAPSETRGVTSTDVSMDGATLSTLVTMSHSVHIDSDTLAMGVAYGAPGMPIGWPFGMRFSSSDLTALGLPGFPSTSRADVRLYTG